MDVDKNFGVSHKNVAAMIDPAFAESPPFQFLEYFKMLDIDYRFDNVESLPADIKGKAMWGHKIHQVDDKAFPAAKEKMYQDLVANTSSSIDFDVVLPDFARINVTL